MLSHAQAMSCGVPRRTISRRVAEGRWLTLHPRVYLVGGHRLTDEGRIRAAWLWLGQDATVSGAAAAYWHRMRDAAPGCTQITIPRSRHRPSRPGVSIRRRDLPPEDREWVRNVLVTGKALTTLETAVALDDPGFLDRALQREVGFTDVYAAYGRMQGSAGAQRAARMLDAAADRADSAAERLLMTLVGDGGLAGWVLGYPFGSFRIDLAFPSRRVAIEVDGWARHVDPQRFRAEQRRGNAVVGAGWTLLRFAWHDLVDDPVRVLVEIRSALAPSG